MVHVTLPMQHSPSPLTALLLAVSNRRSRDRQPKYRGYIVSSASAHHRYQRCLSEQVTGSRMPGHSPLSWQSAGVTRYRRA